MMKVVMTPASAAPKHHVPRLMPITRPRICAGQVSATSMDPSDHSPFSAKLIAQRTATKAAKVGVIAATGMRSENNAMLMASSECLS
jgi:hypothetical protein